MWSTRHRSRIDTPSPSSSLSLSSSSLVTALASNSPAASVRSIYRSILDSTEWIERRGFRRLETLGDDDDVTLDGFNAGHRVVEDAYGHTGCVNAMAWEQGGQERLATAGDDTKICIWTPRGMRGYQLADAIDTGHDANIFSVKWAPTDPNRIFSAAGDATARVYDLSRATSTTKTTKTTKTMEQSWSHHESRSAVTNVLRCHSDRVKRISTEPGSSNTFLTCSEDGTVRQHDLREPHACRRRRRQNDDSDAPTGGCPPPLADYSNAMMRLYSLSLSQLEPHLFVVGGTSPFAYLHDRRMLRTPMVRDWSIAPSGSSRDKLTECVRRFGVPRTTPTTRSGGGGGTGPTSSIVAVKLNPDDSSELIVSYGRGGGVYRFDIRADTSGPASGGRKERGRFGKERQREQDREQQYDLNGDDEGDNDEDEDEDGDDDSDDDGHERNEETDSNKKLKIDGRGQARQSGTGERAVEAERGNLATTENDATYQGKEDDEDDDETEEEWVGLEYDSSESSRQEPRDEQPWPIDPTSRSASSRSHARVPIVAPVTYYCGHANSETVKDVNFAFGGSVVVSGSDDGNFFAWDKPSARCVGIFRGDSSVVNVLEPHPRLPLVAVSGIDNTVKIFGPSSNRTTGNGHEDDDDAATTENLVSEFDAIKRRNEQRNATAERDGIENPMGGLPDALVRLLAANIGRRVVRTGEPDGDDGSDGPQAQPDFRVAFEDPNGTGLERAADCVVM